MKGIANTMQIDWTNKSHVCVLAALYGPNYFVIKHKRGTDYWTVNYEEIDRCLEMGAEIVFRTGPSQERIDKMLARHERKMAGRRKLLAFLVEQRRLRYKT